MNDGLRLSCILPTLAAIAAVSAMPLAAQGAGWRFDGYVAGGACDGRPALTGRERGKLAWANHSFRFVYLMPDETPVSVVVKIRLEGAFDGTRFPAAICASPAQLTFSTGETVRGIVEPKEQDPTAEYRDWSYRMHLENNPLADRIDFTMANPLHLYGMVHMGDEYVPFGGWSLGREPKNRR
ncbi:hypothetical protein [Actibacterium sp. 188UL27-1]|uniref:hypothetical protein n=1 Tax=Actibacterium sp. 188UL27-1 TaxID=2786961 RepID=UPI0019571D7F|nr:hypothetical protein [Actibacterium sp. 188UL27-1]MBM7066483.1 hypothetical protein [Actibacterium sp. 188UL27-1]